MGKSVVMAGGVLLLLLSLDSCFVGAKAGVASSSPGIEGIQWYLIEVGGAPVSNSAGVQRPFLKLDAARKEAAGFSGCNNFFGKYTLSGAALKFGPLGSTRMACPDIQMNLETEFFKALDKTRAWRTDGEELLLLHESGILARLTAQDVATSTPTLTGTVWEWVGTVYNDDRHVGVTDPRKYTVQFRGDETLHVKADCNQKGGTYSTSAEDRRLSIEITHSTMAACPEGSLEEVFVRGLTAAAGYFIENGNLNLDLKYDSGTMRFSRQKEQNR